MLERKLSKFSKGRDSVKKWSTNLCCKIENLEMNLARADSRNCPKNSNNFFLNGICRYNVTLKPQQFGKISIYFYFSFSFVIFILVISVCCVKKQARVSSNKKIHDSFSPMLDYNNSNQDVRVIESETPYMNVR